MAKTPDNKPAVEPVPERTYTAEDFKLFLSWISNGSPYYPDGMNGWGRHGFSPYFEAKPETILRDFNEFLDLQAKQQPEAQPKTSRVK